MRKKSDSVLKLLGQVLLDSISIGAAIIGSIMAGAWVGWLIDEKVFKGKYFPWITTIFIVFGVIGGIKNLIWYSKRSLKEIEKKRYDSEENKS